MSTITSTAPEHRAPEGWEGAPSRLVRHVLAFIKDVFSYCPAGAYQWKPETEASPDQTGSEIFIAADTPLKVEVVGQRPAVTVMRSTASYRGVGIGDQAFVDISTGAQAKMDIVPTNIVVHVLSRFPLETEHLSGFLNAHIWGLRGQLIRSMPGLLYMGQRPSIGAPSPAGALIRGDTEHNWCVVTMTYPAYLQEVVHTYPLNNPILKGFRFNPPDR